MRKNQAFIAVNCAAMPDQLLESELFGHEKGSFTSAIKTKQGLVEVADGGTLFLDEVGDISITTQPVGGVICAGGSDTLTVVATGSPDPSSASGRASDRRRDRPRHPRSGPRL